MKEYIEQRLRDIEQDILLERDYYKVQSLIKDRYVILYLLSFYI
jgi:N-acetylglutamate synthase-like GNAT family acetyltransferase